MQYFESLCDLFPPKHPGTITLSEEEGDGRAYQFTEASGREHDLISATTVVGWGTKDSTVLKHYAHKLTDEATPFNEAMALAVWYSDWATRNGTIYHSSVHRALSTGADHPVRQLPSMQTADLVSCEQRVWSLFDCLAGTMDLPIVHKNGKFSVHDVKTHSRFYSPLAESADEGVWKLDRDVQKSKFTKWWKQLAIYARCLEMTFGIEPDYGSIFVYNVHTGLVEEMGRVSGTDLRKKYAKSIVPKIPIVLDAMFDYGV